MERLTKYLIFILPLALPFTTSAQNSFEVKPVSSVSSSSDDIVSVIVKDGIYFCSNRKTNPFVTKKNLQGEKLYNLYYSSFNRKNEPGKPTLFSSDLKGNFNVGPGCLSPDGRTLYFTRNYFSGKSKKKMNESDKYGIFIAKRQGTSWQNISEFEYNDPRYRLAYPFISPDGKYLFFSSDMQGTLGKSDIFVCENVNDKWSKPVSLGSDVNSSSSEVYPFYHSSGRLYFASDRPGGLGGLDIYYTLLVDGKWSAPVHLDPPINSKGDDFALYSTSPDAEGYFTSDRRRKGDDDIYTFKSTIIRRTSCDTLQKNSYCFEFIEETALQNDTITTKYKWEWDFGDGAAAEGITAEHCYKGPGTYYVELNFINLITGKVERNQASYNLEVSDIEQPYITAPEAVTAGEAITLDASLTNLPMWNISKYYWNFGDETASTGIETTKTFIKPGKYTVQLIVSCVPDANGIVREACVCKDIIVKARNK